MAPSADGKEEEGRRQPWVGELLSSLLGAAAARARQENRERRRRQSPHDEREEGFHRLWTRRCERREAGGRGHGEHELDEEDEPLVHGDQGVECGAA